MTARKVFYGWYIVGAATVSFLLTTAITSMASSVLLKPMIAEMGWSRTDFFAVQPIAAVISAVAAPFVGRLVDRGNPRFLVLAGSLLVTGSVMSYSQVHALWQYLLLAGVVTPAGMALCSMVVYNTVVGKWFVRKRGRAMVITSVGSSLAGVITAPVLVALIPGLGWRNTWAAIGAFALVFLIPMALLVKRSPEDVGLHPDGIPPALPANSRSAPAAEREWRWQQLVRTRTFWLIALIVALAGMSMGSSVAHLFPFLTDRNISPAIAATLFSSASISSLALRPLWGYIIERWDIRLSALMTYLAMALSIALTLVTTNIPALFLSQFFRGLSGVGFVTLNPMLCGHYFGRRSLGQVLGLAHLVGLPFAAAGPVLAARAFDLLHNYVIVFSIFAGLLVLCASLVFFIRPVTKGKDVPATPKAPPMTHGRAG